MRYAYDAVGNRLQMQEGRSDPGAGAAQCAGDQDCDGVLDAVDNCRTIANPSQADSDVDPTAISGLAGGWRFDESSGVTATDMAGTSPGTIVGTQTSPGAQRVAGRFGGGLFFDGDDHVKMPQTTALNVTGPELSLTMWIKPKPGTFGMLIHKNNQYSLFYESGVVKYADSSFWCHGCNGANAIGITPGAWNHVVLVKSATRLKIYVNGTLATDIARTGNITAQSTALHLGCWSGRNGGDSCNNDFPFFGEMDEVGVVSRALTPVQIAALAANPLRMNDTLGDACDACPQNNDLLCAPTTCRDLDGDGYGLQGASACSAGAVALFDCNDNDRTIHPNAMDVCDSKDNDSTEGLTKPASPMSRPRRTSTTASTNSLLPPLPPVRPTFEYDLNGEPDPANLNPAERPSTCTMHA